MFKSPTSLVFWCKKPRHVEIAWLNKLFMFMTGREMLHEKNKEIDGMNKEFQRQIQILVEDHKKEVDVSTSLNYHY